ncbi:hypothetical protein [Singulisphaera acidiphila]|uniref:Uncharacterized protein n=1 Tax=Singulisphaera acidiphila (strain ATCC BAA-1392 / DSM 18658 / VKM B-2454 / MOB10) TaxID=886293 RepID=L0DR79_SINAD|nr:hypothetical protein [Singulisphaera acidiphila]AGA31482.1 hypothetical protein Sinac_7447 [Singulisphaera acidiphila DSM 18658]
MKSQRFRAILGGAIGVLVCGLVGAGPGTKGGEAKPVSPPKVVTPAKSPSPGTPAFKRVLIQDALVRQGLAPVFRVGIDSRPEPIPMRTQVPADRGTTIVPHPKAMGDMLRLQKTFAAALAAQDTRPAERRNHFAWLDNTDAFKKKLVHPIGWHGGIEEVEQTPTGSVLVKIHIRPWLYSNSFKTLQFDYVAETYEFFRGKVRLVDSDANVAKPELQGFPVLQ